MISRYRFKKLQWIDVESPTDGEIRDFAEEYKCISELRLKLPYVLAHYL